MPCDEALRPAANRAPQLKEADVDREQELERMRLLLRHHEKLALIGQLAAGVAHEINNPIGYVSANLANLREYLAELNDLIAALRRLRDSVDRTAGSADLDALLQGVDLDFLQADVPALVDESMQGMDVVRTIVADLKDFSHREEGRWEHVDLNVIVESALRIVASELKYRATVRRELMALPPLWGNARLLMQMLVNLLVNAAQAVENDGVIGIASRLHEDAVELEISDNGPGMDRAQLAAAFEPFFTTKPAGQGTGLGLSITREIVLAHRGEIDCDTAPGKGARFRIRLPLAGTTGDESADR